MHVRRRRRHQPPPPPHLRNLGTTVYGTRANLQSPPPFDSGEDGGIMGLDASALKLLLELNGTHRTATRAPM